MDWLKGFFRNAEYSGQGSLIKLSDVQDNYTKKTEFMNATLIVKNKELFVKNDEYDSDQDQIEYISFPLNVDSQLIHYTISDEEVKIECVKWVNLNSVSINDAFYGFEFENPQAYSTFETFVSKYVQIDEEGYQDPSNRTKNWRDAQASLVITSNTVPSNIFKAQLTPEIIPEEEKAMKSDLNFKRIALQNLSHLYSPNSILYLSPADLYLLGPNLNAPLLTDRGIGFLIIRHPEFRISLDLVREDQIIMRIIINSKFYIKVEQDTKYVSWVEDANEFERRTWKAELCDDVRNIETLINIARYEDEKKSYVAELNDEDQKWVKGEDEYKSEISIHEAEEKMEIDFEENTAQTIEEDNAEIFDTAQSWKDSRVYAARKGKISMYSDTGNGFERTSILDLDYDPSNILLQQQDTRLLYLNKARPNIVYNLDLTRCQIVDEFKIKEAPLGGICHLNKLSQLTDSGQFLGFTGGSLYMIDPRDPNKIVKDYTYSKSIDLSCMATTQQGYIAAGSETGDIRLYKEIGKRSTTNFPGLGHPIISIDTTKDGSWMLATTETYLMVIQTMLEGELAYTKSLARKRKAPRKLQLSPEDIAKYDIAAIHFTPARFNISDSIDENAIITSTGKLVII